jgi:hypothetical protein
MVKNKIRRFKVTAYGKMRKSGKTSKIVKDEIIDTKNKIFRECENCIDVLRIYESFWNDLNPKSKEVIVVTNVVELKPRYIKKGVK